MGAHGSKEKLYRTASERFPDKYQPKIQIGDKKYKAAVNRERFGSFGVRGAAKKRDAAPGPVRPLSPPQTAPPANTPSHAPPSGGYAPQLRSRGTPPVAVAARPTAPVKKSNCNGVTGTTPPSINNNNVLPKGLAPVARKPISRRAATQLSPRIQPLKDQNRPSSPAPVLKTPPRPGAAPLQAGTTVCASTQSPQTRDVEALAVLVQYLVFQLDALNGPRWKAQATEAKAHLSEAAGRLQRALQLKDADCNAKISSITVTADNKYRAALEESAVLAAEIRSLKVTLGELKRDVAESRARVVEAENANKNHMNELKIAHEEIERLRKTNIDIEKNLTSQKQENEAMRLSQQQREAKENIIIKSETENKNGINRKLKESSNSKENEMAAEVESLKSVLEMKMEELTQLRKKCAEYQHAADLLPPTEQRVITLTALVEDLRTQLNHKSQEENTLKQQMRLLEESFVRESTAKNRLSQHNEELKYKLRHNSEVYTYLAGIRNDQNASVSPNHRRSVQDTSAPELSADCEGEQFARSQMRTNFVRAQMRTSFNEKLLNLPDWGNNLRRCTRSESSDSSEKNRLGPSFQGDDPSPPNSPKIKGVVEKNDSVSYVLEIEETPEEMASRLVQRAGSFRAAPSSTREAVKRQRSRGKAKMTTSPHILSQSASASCIEPVSLRTSSEHCKLFRSNSIEPNQYDSTRPLRTSTPRKNGLRLRSISSGSRATSSADAVPENQHNETFTGNNNGIEGMESSYESNASVNSSDLGLLQENECVPKESAGEALISGANSEDDSSLDEPSHSSSDSESGCECDKYLDINGAGERLADPVLQKIAETMDQSLSATPMDVSWSEDGVTGVSETDI